MMTTSITTTSTITIGMTVAANAVITIPMSILGVRISWTLGDIDPLHKVPFYKSRT